MYVIYLNITLNLNTLAPVRCIGLILLPIFSLISYNGIIFFPTIHILYLYNYMLLQYVRSFTWWCSYSRHYIFCSQRIFILDSRLLFLAIVRFEEDVHHHVTRRNIYYHIIETIKGLVKFEFSILNFNHNKKWRYYNVEYIHYTFSWYMLVKCIARYDDDTVLPHLRKSIGTSIFLCENIQFREVWHASKPQRKYILYLNFLF
jgi:hypothetical protein